MPLNSSHIEESFSTTDEDLKILLSGILNLNIHDSHSEKIIINTINKLLSVSKTRSQGLEFLSLIISNCSQPIIAENALIWISYCLVKYTGDNLKEVKLSTIGRIIENSYNKQEFNKRFISDYISKILETCLSTHSNSHETEAALQTLATCMKYYSSWFTPHKDKIETFILTFLESPSDSLVEKAALAFLNLQQVGGAGTDGINHKLNFSTNFSKTCITVQKLFDVFFENEIEIDDSNRSTKDGFSFVDLSHHSQKMQHIQARRITNCLKFLKIMLLKSFPVAKEIKPTELLDIISRGIALHHCLTMDNEKSLTDFQFSLLLNRIQIQLLELLRIFIIWLQENALPFSFTISKVLIDCLKKIQNCQCFTSDSLYQEVVYKVLGCWLRVSKNSFHTHFQTQLVTCILKDITPVKNSITLNLQTDTKNKSAKARRKFIQDKIISSGQSSSTEKFTPTEKQNIEKKCLFALGALKQILIATTLKLKANLLQDLYTTIISSVLDIQTSKFIHPYTNNNCQEKLYEVLVAFYEQEMLKTLPPLHLTLDILNKGISNRNRHIALTCEHGLSIIEKLCQPVCPTLFMPEMFVSEKPFNKPEELFSKQVLDDLANEKLMENGKNEDVLENGNSNHEDEEMDVVVKDIENNITENITEEETNTEDDTKIHGETIDEEMNVDIEGGSNQDMIVSQSITKEKSIHIIDVHVIKTSATDLEVQDAELTDVLEEPNIEGVEENSSYHDENITTEINIFKTEIVSRIDINDEPKSPEEMRLAEDINQTEHEPPLKKSKIEVEDAIIEDVKEEPKVVEEEVDDIFEENGAFVDEVKEY